jgi:serine/threonine protein kinase
MSEAEMKKSDSVEDRNRPSEAGEPEPSEDSQESANISAKYPLVGQRLSDRYDVLRAIAAGGMGTVYRARHLLMDKIVAVKVLNESYAREPNALARFKQEAKIACQMSHPNIVVVHDFGIADDSCFYLVMDYVEGETLADILDYATNLPVERVVNLGIQICAGLEHAHELGLVHRDLKPSNLMLVRSKSGADQLKILDFGLAKVLAEGKEQGLSQSGYLLGTGYYMSPEQCRGKKATVQSEIYSIGCVLYELLIGLPPFSGDNLLETLQQHIDGRPEPMSARRPDLNLPPEIEKIVGRAMEKNPESRYQSAQELGEALKQLGAQLREDNADALALMVPGIPANQENPATATPTQIAPAKAANAPAQPAPAAGSSEGGSSTAISTRKDSSLPKANNSTQLKQWLSIAAGVIGTIYLIDVGLGNAHKAQTNAPVEKSGQKQTGTVTTTKETSASPARQGSQTKSGDAVVTTAKKVTSNQPNDAEDERIAHMAMVCHKNGECDTAVDLLKRAVAISKKVHGKNSLQTAKRLTELASLYSALDEPEKAHPLMEEVMEIRAAQKSAAK